jgi:vanillate O-demethylase ferredoxin subunit
MAISPAPGAAGGRHRVTVSALREEAEDIVSVTLSSPEGALAPFEPGAHVRVHLPGGLERSYSLCNRDPRDGCYTLAVKKEPQSRGGSAAVHALRLGDALEIAGPFNLFPVDWSERHLVLVAGGIGITPIFSMGLEALRRGHSFELHYFARGAGHAAFLSDLRECAWRDRAHLHLGMEGEQVRALLAKRFEALGDGDAVYVCGPRPLIGLARELAGVRLPPCAIHWESFGGEGAVLESGGDQPFDIRLADGSGPYHVPSGKSALEILLEAGLDVPYSCREGECGMCVLDVAEGTPEHRDRFLNPEVRESNGCMAVCVSRARTPVIVLDF